ncbi:MAG: MBL fold metallo-hydrolase [Candidatus Baldrarchaeia archaeon]
MAGDLNIRMIAVESPGDFRVDVNVYLIGRRDWILVDSAYGLNKSISKILGEINRYAGGVRNLKLVLNTHAHPDHFPGSTVLKEKYGVPIAIHEYAAPLLGDFKKYVEKYTILRGKDADIFVKEYLTGMCGARETNIDVPVKDGDVIEVSGYEFRVIHTPGHSPCHVCLYQPDEGILFSGDTVLKGMSTWIGVPDGDVLLYLDSLERLKKLDISVIYPAHGPIIMEPKEIIEENRQKKLSRMKDILEHLKEGPKTVKQLVNELYKSKIWRQKIWMGSVVKAYLIALEKLGRVRRIPRENLPSLYELI